MNETVRKCILYFSLKSRREREYEEYIKKIKELKSMSNSEFQSEYIWIKTRYEHKKLNITLLGVVIVLSILSNTVSLFCIFLKRVFQLFLIEQNNVEATETIFILSSVIVGFIIFLVTTLLFMFLKDLEYLYKNLLIMTEFKKKEGKQDE